MAMSDSTGWLAAPPPLPSLRRGPEPARIGNVLVGTASWTEKTLVASRAFYPAGVTTAEQRLRYYTRHFPVVEVDATYYALPSLENARRWAEVAERLAGFQVAVEFRQSGWMTERRAPRTLDFLRRTGLVYVGVDEPQGTAASVPPVAAATSEALSVVRFHGRRVETWTRPGVSTTERFRYLYRPEELREWVDRIRDLAGKSRQVYALMNNCYRHYGVENAKDLAGLLAAA